MPTPGPAEILRRNRERANAFAQKAGGDRTKRLLQRAQRDLERRLREAEGLRGPGVDSFTAGQIRVTLAQVEDVLQDLKRGMRGEIVGAGRETAEREAGELVEYLQKAERSFRGVNQPLPINEARMVDRVVQGTEASVLRRILSDPDHPGRAGVLDRYGENVIDRFEEQLQLRFIARKPWAEVRDAIVQESTFLQDAPAYWAERIVRTETIAANNRAGWETIRAADSALGDMVKILSATFDSRTAADSFAVHGEIRRPTEAFESWFGLYQHPPNRPNDREVVVPHRVSWPIPPALSWKSDSEIAARWAKEGRKGAVPKRPKMTTVDLALFGATPPPPPATVPQPAAVEEKPTVREPPRKVQAQVPADIAPPPPEVIPEPAPVRPPRFRDERARARYAREVLASLPDHPDFSIPSEGIRAFRHRLRTHSDTYEIPWGEDRRQNVYDLAEKVRGLEKRGEATALRQVRIEQIIAIQPDVQRNHIEEAIEENRRAMALSPHEAKAPILVRHKGKLYVQEGLENIVAADMAARRTVRAHVIDLDARHPLGPPPKPKVEPPKPAVEAKPSFAKVPVEKVKINDAAKHVIEGGLSGSVRYDSEGFNRSARKVFGEQGMPTIETLQKTWSAELAGHKVRLNDARAHYDRIEFSGDIVDERGTKIGKIVRSFIRRDDGCLEVHHDYFKITDQKEMGKKTGETMLRQAIQTYEELGVHEVTVDAAWIGQYAWATFGYNWDSDSAALRGRWLSKFLEKNGLSRERADKIAKEVSPRAWDVAALDVDGIMVDADVNDGVKTEKQRLKLGKAFMLTHGMWSGSIKIDPKHETYQRAKERIGL